MSGNGIRCLAQAAVDAGLGHAAHVLGGHGRRRAHGDLPSRRGAGLGPGQRRHGRGDPGPEAEPIDGRTARTADVGNPHLVLVGLRGAGRGPRSTSAVRGPGAAGDLPRGDQRGVDRARPTTPTGTSSSCGSGSAAPGRRWPAVPAAWRPPRWPGHWGWCGGSGPVRVHNPGGMLEVTLGRGAERPGRAGRPGAQGGRHRASPGDALLTDVLPGTLIDRSFRERIILVGVAFPGSTLEAVDEAMDELAQLVDSAGADVVARVVPTPGRSGPGHLRRAGQGGGDRRVEPVGRRRHGGLRRGAEPGPATEPGEGVRAHRHRPHGGDPRHLRPERPESRGQGPGGAGAAALPPAPAAGPGRRALPTGRWHRHPGPGGDPARGGPSTPGPTHAPPGVGPARGGPHALAAAAEPGPWSAP